jgi:hypothetical protein
MSAEEPEGFLARWSRRKRAAAEPAPPETPPETLPPGAALPERGSTAPAAATPPGPGCPIPNLPEIDLASLPSVEELTAQSDFSLFLRPGIPAALRSAALRRMWSLDPAIRDYIGPVDYQWDFNTPGGLPAGFASELVGDVKKLLAQAIGQPDPEEDAARDAAEVAPADAMPPEPAEPTAPEAPPLLAEAPEPLPEPAPAAPAEPPLRRRRHGGALPA